MVALLAACTRCGPKISFYRVSLGPQQLERIPTKVSMIIIVLPRILTHAHPRAGEANMICHSCLRISRGLPIFSLTAIIISILITRPEIRSD